MASGLSPWLHFGHVSVHEAFAAVTERERWTPAKLAATTAGKKEGYWNLAPSSEAFLDELVTWRELGLNFGARRADRYTCNHRSLQGPGVKPEHPIRIDLERFLPYRLSVLTNAVSGAIAGVYQQRFGLSTPEWRVLAVLARYPGLAAAEVAALTRMDAVAVSRAVTRLLGSGRLRRSMSPHDRRRSMLQVSSDGEALYREVAPLALRFERDLLAAEASIAARVSAKSLYLPVPTSRREP